MAPMAPEATIAGDEEEFDSASCIAWVAAKPIDGTTEANVPRLTIQKQTFCPAVTLYLLKRRWPATSAQTNPQEMLIGLAN
jgi:hypothetical protein